MQPFVRARHNRRNVCTFTT